MSRPLSLECIIWQHVSVSRQNTNWHPLSTKKQTKRILIFVCQMPVWLYSYFCVMGGKLGSNQKVKMKRDDVFEKYIYLNKSLHLKQILSANRMGAIMIYFCFFGNYSKHKNNIFLHYAYEFGPVISTIH